MQQARCPICEKLFDREQSKWLPFCSPRCKLIDLGRWLEERYGLPYEPEDEKEPRPTPPARQDGESS